MEPTKDRMSSPSLNVPKKLTFVIFREKPDFTKACYSYLLGLMLSGQRRDQEAVDVFMKQFLPVSGALSGTPFPPSPSKRFFWLKNFYGLMAQKILFLLGTT